MASKIKFQDPPADQRRGNPNPTKGTGKHAEIAAKLRSKPGRWALIQESVSGGVTVTIVKTAKFAAYEPAGAFEATSRRRPDGRFDIYARYLGEA